jgi:hypothetical protein
MFFFGKGRIFFLHRFCKNHLFKVAKNTAERYSTVTDLAKFLGISTSRPFCTAI